MQTAWQVSYMDPRMKRMGLYSASIYKAGDGWKFAAYPSRGDIMTESRVESDLDTLIAKAEAYLNGVNDPNDGFYAASF